MLASRESIKSIVLKITTLLFFIKYARFCKVGKVHSTHDMDNNKNKKANVTTVTPPNLLFIDICIVILTPKKQKLCSVINVKKPLWERAVQ